MPNGAKISRQEAVDILALKESIRQEVIQNVHPVLPYINISTAARKFLSDDYNAFIFDKDIVKRFFDGDSENPSLKAEYLIVFLGAHPVANSSLNVEVGDPTVMLAGAVRKPDTTDEFLTLNLSFPATEHPPKKALINFPGA